MPARLATMPGVCALLLTALLPSGVEAALPASPFELSVAPTTVRAGDTARVTVASQPGHGTWDLYVVWLYTEAAAFLAEDGTWRPRPVPFRARVASGQTISGPWTGAGPPGPVTLALVAVEPGRDPLLRLDWRVRPSLASLRIAPRDPPRSVLDAAHLPRTVLLAGAALLAIVVGLALPRVRAV
jgi:hypothetical protein